MKDSKESRDKKQISGTAGADVYAGAEKLHALAECLPPWYEKNKRDLPWRGTGDPYDVWISEIMLQQTRVAAVMEYYRRFKRELPGAAELAACDDDRLMKLWQGLGYYSRARNLKRTAVILTERYGGHLPGSAEELLKLPGIGSYTAGAIASIAFGLPVPAVDGNVMRVCARVCGNDADISLPGTKRSLEGALGELLSGEGAFAEPGTFNQALMELGALVCVPNGPPLCEECPVREACTARREHLTDQLPVRQPKKARRIEKKTVFLIRSGERYLIRRRPPKGLLAGLWEFPSEAGFLTEDEALRAVEKLISGRTSAAWVREPLFIKKLQNAKHIFTHVEWHMQGYEVSLGEGTDVPGSDDLRFAEAEEIGETYSIPSAFSRYTEIVLN